MARTFFLFLTLSGCLLPNALNAQSSNNTDWAKWQFLIGDWEGQGTGQPGEGTGGFSLQPDLDGKVLIRKNHAEYPAANDRLAFSHRDIMIVAPGETENTAKAVYYDNQGHIIDYTVSFGENPKAIIFISSEKTNAPRFRLTYTEISAGKIGIRFETAPPGKAESFKTYIEAKAVRKK
jgi:hypothetical protein